MEQNQKTLLTAVIGGFACGLLTAILCCTICCGVNHKPCFGQHMPPKMAMHWQGHHHKHMRHFKEPSEEMKARFAAKLGLSDEQKALLDKYRTEDMAKMKPLFEQMKDLKAQIKQARDEGRKHFESVLTDEQKNILQEMRQKHHFGKHRHHGKKNMKPMFVDDAPEKNAVVNPEVISDAVLVDSEKPEVVNE